MGRPTLDRLVSFSALILATVLVLGSGLLFWAGNFVGGEVHSQLSAQKIFFPPQGEGIADPRIKPYVEKYAGQQLVNGAQAKVYADHFIAVHLQDIGGGKTYSELSTASRNAPDDAKLSAAVQTVFRGETLRGLLLNAYAFDTMGTVAGYAGFVALVAGLLLLVLAVLGLRHARVVAVATDPAPGV